jgi:hypothetical protein
VWGKGEMHPDFWWGALKERGHMEDSCIEGRIIFIKMDLQNVSWGGGGTDWIDLAQDKDRRWAVVNMVMNFRVP